VLGPALSDDTVLAVADEIAGHPRPVLPTRNLIRAD
jgi:hypothetical protein